MNKNESKYFNTARLMNTALVEIKPKTFCRIYNAVFKNKSELPRVFDCGLAQVRKQLTNYKNYVIIKG